MNKANITSHNEAVEFVKLHITYKIIDKIR